MPYVEGESLRDQLAREKQLPRPALAVVGLRDVDGEIVPANGVGPLGDCSTWRQMAGCSSPRR